MIQDKTKSVTVDATKKGLVQTINIPNGELWYVEEFRAAGEHIEAAENFRNTGIKVATAISADPNSQPQRSGTGTKSAAGDETRNNTLGGRIETYVSGESHQLQVRVINEYGEVNRGTYYVVIKARRVL